MKVGLLLGLLLLGSALSAACFELWRNGQRWQSLAVVGIVGFNLALFTAGLWLLRGSVMRPPLLDHEARFQGVIEYAADGIVIAGAGGLVTHLNAAAEKLFGWPRAELYGKPVAVLFAEAHRAAVAEVFERLAAKGEAADGKPLAQIEGLRRDGTSFPADVSISLHGGRADPMYTCAFGDATERTQTAAKMMHMDRMIAVGTLAAGVGHEINNPLAYIVANLGFIGEELPGVARDCQVLDQSPGVSTAPQRLAELVELVREAREGAERVRVIVRDLKTLSHADEESLDLVDVAEVIEAAVKMTWNEVRHRARLVKDLAPVPKVMANESRLGQVLVNLLVNAAQAIPEGAAQQNEIRVRTLACGGQVHIEVSDSGCGIPPENLAHIFDPFFTTKPVGQGTGLGLAISQNIVQSLGGELQVQANAERGTTFRVVLPQPPQRPAVASEEPVPQTAPLPQLVRRGRVLVVDDELAICRVLRRALGREHDVTQAGGGRAALELLRAGKRFDIILCDLLMPELTGMELHQELLLCLPEQAQKMVFITGGAFTPSARQFLDRVPNQRIEKPFDSQAVRAIVRNHVRHAAKGA